MKNKICIYILLCLVCIICVPHVYAASGSSIKLKESNLTLMIDIGPNGTICEESNIAFIKKNGISVKKITYVSKNKKVATVSKKGVVTAVNPGKTQIKARVKFKKGAKLYTKTLICNVTVKGSDFVSSVLDKRYITMQVGDIIPVSATCIGETNWKIDNSRCVEFYDVSSTENKVWIKANASGSCKLTVVCADGGIYNCYITVK